MALVAILAVLAPGAPVVQNAAATAVDGRPVEETPMLAAGELGAKHAAAAAIDGKAAEERPEPAGDDGNLRSEAARGGGSYRSPGGSFGGGARTGVSPGGGYRTGPRAPSPNVTRPPGATTPGGGGFMGGRAGSFFGGLAAGALLGHLFNPFAGWGAGYGYGGFGMSLISLLFWGVLLYVVYRIVRRLFGGRGRRDGNGRGGWYR